MKTEEILRLLREAPEQLDGFAKKMYGIYEAEYGGAWVEREIAIAEKRFWDGECSIDLEFADVLKKLESEQRTDLFIGTSPVSNKDFITYSKGLYFLAAFRIARAN